MQPHKTFLLHSLSLHWLVEYLEVQYFSISSAVLPGILPAIKDHLRKNLLFHNLHLKGKNKSGSAKESMYILTSPQPDYTPWQ